jgi:autotransporter-associated beta strand protein
LGYLTYGGNDWLAPASNLTNGFQVYAGYSNDLFASGDNSNVTLTTDTVTANTPTNTIRFNTAVAGVVTISNGVTLTVSHGGILMGSTVGTNSSTITGGSITSGNTNGDGSHDLILINNDTTASGGNLVIASSIVNPSVGTIGITAGQTVPGTVPGQIQLGGTNTFSSPSYIDGGTVVLENAGAWNGNSALNFAPYDASTTGGTFALNGNSITVNGLATTQSQLNPIVENAVGANAVPATLTVNVASGGNTYAGTLQDGTDGGTLALAKTGNGALTLTGTSSLTGGTTISGGTLFANNATNSLGTGVVNVNGGLLAGNGVINNGSNQLTVAGGKIGAGATATATGKLTTGSQTWNSGGLTIKANDTGNSVSSGATGAGTAGSTTGWDEVVMSALTLGSNLSSSPFAVTLTGSAVADFSGGAGYLWPIAQITSGTPISTGTILASTNSNGTNTPIGSELFTLDTSNFVTNNPSATDGFYLEALSSGSGETLDIGYTAAPEPGTAMLVLGGAMPTLLSRRRRKSRRDSALPALGAGGAGGSDAC